MLLNSTHVISCNSLQLGPLGGSRVWDTRGFSKKQTTRDRRGWCRRRLSFLQSLEREASECVWHFSSISRRRSRRPRRVPLWPTTFLQTVFSLLPLPLWPSLFIALLLKCPFPSRILLAASDDDGGSVTHLKLKCLMAGRKVCALFICAI